MPPSARADVEAAEASPSGSDPTGFISARDLSPADRFARVHNAVCRHHGIQATITMLKDAGLDFPHMWKEVSEFIMSCPTCQKVRLGQPEVNEAFATTAVSEPFECVAVDFLGPLPSDEYNNTYICVSVCKFTRLVELEPCRAATAKEAARAVLQWDGR